MKEFPPCKSCGHPPTSNVGGSWFRSSLNLIAMAANASTCLTCSILCAGIRKYLSNTSLPVPTDIDQTDMRLGTAACESGGMAVLIWLFNINVELSFFCSEKTSWIFQTLPFLEVGKQVPKTTSSDESFSWAIQQINHCRDSHQNCNSYLSSATLPKRVVFVGTAAEPTLRLYESQGESDPYICLSYCWGHRPFGRTLVDNLESHKICIEPDHLPPTLHDAIEYTRRLGVRYIWIDSLCIIQDSILDWREEAGKMASIFQKSFLVLSATGSADAYEGIHAPSPSDYETFALTVDTKTNEVCNSHVADQANLPKATNATETIYVRRTFAHVKRATSKNYAIYFPMLPTLKRGWIFQERLLSSRVLHFGPHELYFECLEDSACQCTDHHTSSMDQESVLGPKGRVNETTPRESRTDKFQEHSTMHQTKTKAYYDPLVWRIMSRDELMYVWHRLVHDYTKLELTYEKDLFPAISGLAREMSFARAARDADEDMVQGTVYLAGLWKDSLVRDLCWKVEFESMTQFSDDKDEVKRIKAWSDRALEWRAPTWSWGSVNAPVEFLNQRNDLKDFFEPLCEVLDVSCTAAGSDEMGELIGGRLVLRGELFPAKVTHSRFKTHREDGLRFPWQILGLDLGAVVENFVQQVFVDDGCQDLLRLLDEVEAGGDRPIVYCFLLGTTKIITWERDPVFLLLKKVKGQSEEERGQDVYQRFGWLELTGPPRRSKLDHRPLEERFSVLAQAKEEVVTII